MSFILRRLVFYVVAAWVALTINFFIPRAHARNAVEASWRSSQPCSPRPTARWRRCSGWDIPARSGISTGPTSSMSPTSTSAPTSPQYPAQVSTLLGETLPWTLILVGTATVIAFLVGTALGIVAGWRHGGRLDRVLPGLMFLQAIPYFFLALILVEVFAVKFHFFPLGQGYGEGLIPGWHWAFIGSAIYHSLLPALTIVLTSIAGWMLQMRNVMITTDRRGLRDRGPGQGPA